MIEAGQKTVHSVKLALYKVVEQQNQSLVIRLPLVIFGEGTDQDRGMRKSSWVLEIF